MTTETPLPAPSDAILALASEIHSAAHAKQGGEKPSWAESIAAAQKKSLKTAAKPSTNQPQ